MQLRNKTAVVTGGASGIGAEIARAFALQGAAVCVADINLAAAEELAASLAGPQRGMAVRMDVTDEVVTATPLFLGANPGEVEKGPRSGLRATTTSTPGGTTASMARP